MLYLTAEWTWNVIFALVYTRELSTLIFNPFALIIFAFTAVSADGSGFNFGCEFVELVGFRGLGFSKNVPILTWNFARLCRSTFDPKHEVKKNYKNFKKHFKAVVYY